MRGVRWGGAPRKATHAWGPDMCMQTDSQALPWFTVYIPAGSKTSFPQRNRAEPGGPPETRWLGPCSPPPTARPTFLSLHKEEGPSSLPKTSGGMATASLTPKARLLARRADVCLT